MNRTAVLALLMLIPSGRPAAEPPSAFQQNAAFFQAKCAKCHTVGRGDRVGPDLKGVLSRRDRAWLMGFLTKTQWYLDNDPEAKALLSKFNGVRMESLGLSEPQAGGLLAYIDEASKGPVGPEDEPELEEQEEALKVQTPAEGRGPWLPGIAGVLSGLALALVFWHFGLRFPAVALLALCAAGAYWSLGGRRYHHLLGDQQGYSPKQPIAYSHKLHAGKLKIDCVYCHSSSHRSDVAGVPPLKTCMNCHSVVKKASGAKEPSKDIEAFIAQWETRVSTAPQAPQWNRIHHLPDYVHFSHRVHVANNIKCQECHGPIQEMVQVRQAASLSMGWCLDCHKKGSGEAPAHWKRSGGPRDCAACHW